MTRLTLLLAACLALGSTLPAADANRLSHLASADVYHPGRSFPRLVTPQWVGEKGVEAVVVLAIDDMRGPDKWERYLRPALERLKKIDGRAPVSIMTCQIDPADAHLQKWLKEGLSLETHTIDHPCPLLGRGGLEQARSTYDRCIDLLARVPGNRPVAFRTPCCDSQNTPSPRFFAEIFNRVTPAGHHLAIDSSVFNVPTANDTDLPRALVTDSSGGERFRKYLPAHSPFGNSIEDYPYPYVINRLCWEFPCATPSDWQGQNRHGKASPLILADMKASLDIAVRKQGVFTLVFHPYGWMSATQVVDLIDHAVARHGKKVLFLTFREAHDRLVRHLLAGQPLRTAEGADNGVRVLDLDGDGFQDVVIGNDRLRQTRLWRPGSSSWVTSDFPVSIVEAEGTKRHDGGVGFGILRPDGAASLLVARGRERGLWHFIDGRWQKQPDGLDGLQIDGQPLLTAEGGRDRGVRLHDLDGNGVCELLVGNEARNAAFAWTGKGWRRLPFALPAGARFVDAAGRDGGLRLIDLDEDGCVDVLFSDDRGFGIHLFDSITKGWNRRVAAGKRGEAGELPAIVRDGTNNGLWVHSRQLWWQNERTALLPGLVERRSFNDLLREVEPRPRSPEASLRSLQARPGFTVELTATEPLVRDPIAFAWGPDGRVWVVEMGDYPLGADGKGKPDGRVAVLEDTNGDGKYDKRSTFLDGLAFPTGVLPWRGGALITCAPDILFAEDLDGDGQADRRQALYTGFTQGNQQHRVNSLVWGLDNWIHVANGDSGGMVVSLKTGKKLDIRGRDLRIRPDTGAMEAQTGQTQFGRSRDDQGNWFGGNNSVPMWHFVLADHYVRRNPHFAPPEPRVQVPAVPGAAPVFARSRTLPRFNDPGAAGRFTSACSPIVYRDDLFGPAFSASLFVAEPVHNLVHREVISPEGVTFRGRRATDETDREFLASTDHWFRPTMVQTGPDGALWVADMYRAVIEHPEWIPKETQKRLDLRAGHEMGRLYRVFPVDRRPRAIPRLDRLDTAALAAALESPSGWQRDTVHQMLVWKKDRSAVPHVEKQLRAVRATTRMQALCVLDGLDALTPAHLTAALGDTDAAVRQQAVRLCEGRLPGDERLTAAFLGRAADAAPPVRLQLACSLGEWNDPRAGKALGILLRRDLDDRFIHAAAMTSLTPGNLPAVLASALEAPGAPSSLVEALMRQATAMNVPAAVVALLDRAAGAAGKPADLDVLAAFLDGLAARGSSLQQLSKTADSSLRPAVERVRGVLTTARERVADERRTADERVRDIRLLGRDRASRAADRDLLAGLLEPRVAPAVQAAAVQALARLDDAAVPPLLLQGWKGHAPAQRERVLEALLLRTSRVPALLDALEKKVVLPLEIDATRRQRLLEHRDAAIRSRAARVLAGAIAGDRQKLIDAYLPASRRAGDVSRGKAVFTKVCSVCHKLDGAGNEVGPDLAVLADKSADYMLTAILDPNRAVEARYLSYQAETVDGRVLAGILAAETGSSVTLVGSDGKAQNLLRRDIERLVGTGKSLMPEGVEKDVPPEAMADLLSFLRSKQKATAPKSFPGNRPALVRPDGNGELHLTAASAEIHGPKLVLEKQYGNLGYWSDAADRAVWTIEIPRAGAYQVWLDHACDGANAGNTFLLECDAVLLAGRVEGTGSWDVYQKKAVGRVTLPAGTIRLTMRAQGAPRGALIDLRGIRLVPAK